MRRQNGYVIHSGVSKGGLAIWLSILLPALVPYLLAACGVTRIEGDAENENDAMDGVDPVDLVPDTLIDTDPDDDGCVVPDGQYCNIIDQCGCEDVYFCEMVPSTHCDSTSIECGGPYHGEIEIGGPCDFEGLFAQCVPGAACARIDVRELCLEWCQVDSDCTTPGSECNVEAFVFRSTCVSPIPVEGYRFCSVD